MKKNLKLVFYSNTSSTVQSVSLNNKKLIVAFLSVSILFLSIILSLSFLFINIYTNETISDLKQRKKFLASQLSDVEKQIESLNRKMQRIEKFDGHMRIMADLPKVDDDTRELGIGGLDDQLSFEIQSLPKDLFNKTKDAYLNLSRLERKISFQNISFIQIESEIRINEERIHNTPSIRPVRRGRLKSEYGYRIDPFLNIRCFHRGIDIAAYKGTPIVSPSDGVVLKVNTTRWLDRGLGKYVYIDHGFGLVSIYGHLSKVDVKVGQVVKRWEKIGEVGRTGRSTGDHLHYQIKKENRSVDPMDYIIDR